jgi:tape measure domain-containing protein
MAEYRIRFTAETSGAKRSIADIKQAIKEVGKEFEAAEIGSSQFRKSASQLGALKSSLAQAQSAVANLSKEYRQLGESSRSSLDAQNKAIKSQQFSARGLVSEVAKLAAAYFTVQTAQRAFQTGIQRIESERRIKALSAAFGEVEKTQDAAARAAQRFGLSQSEANQAFSQIYARLRPIGISLEQIESSFNGFNTAARLSGATAQEASSAWLQLSQALGSGLLRGEELNSVFEQTPAVVQAIAKEMNAPIGQIRELAKEGEITSDIVIRALQRIEREGADQLAEAMKGPAQQIKNLQNEFENLQVAATTDLIPSVINIVKELKNTLESLGPVIRGLGFLTAQTLGTIADLVNAATKPGAYAAAVSIRAGRLPLGLGGAEELFKGTSGAGGVGLTGLREEAKQLAKTRRQPINTVMLELMQNRLARMEAPTVPPRPVPVAPFARGGKAPKKKGAKSRISLEQLLDLESQRKLALDLSDKELRVSNLITEAKLASNEAEAKSLESLLPALKIQGEIAALQDFRNMLIENEGQIIAKSLTKEQFNNKLQDSNVKLHELSNELQQEFNKLKISENEQAKEAQRLLDEELGKRRTLKRLLEDARIRAGLIGPTGAALISQRREFEDAQAQFKEAGGDPAQLVGIQAGIPEPGSIGELYKNTKDELDSLTDSTKLLGEAANGIGSAFAKSFTDVLTGAQSWKEGLGSAFQSVASMFADMVAQMLAKWAAMQIIGMFLPGASGPARGTPGATAPNGAAYFGPAFANGGIAHGGFRAFASGGIVTGPTLGLVGEGRFNEAVVPLPDGKKIPVELGDGAGSNIATNIVVNVNNGQASSQMSGNGGQSLGRELEGAVRSVILKETRPGGIIYNQR